MIKCDYITNLVSWIDVVSSEPVFKDTLDSFEIAALIAVSIFGYLTIGIVIGAILDEIDNDWFRQEICYDNLEIWFIFLYPAIFLAEFVEFLFKIPKRIYKRIKARDLEKIRRDFEILHELEEQMENIALISTIKTKLPKKEASSEDYTKFGEWYKSTVKLKPQ